MRRVGTRRLRSLTRPAIRPGEARRADHRRRHPLWPANRACRARTAGRPRENEARDPPSRARPRRAHPGRLGPSGALLTRRGRQRPSARLDDASASTGAGVDARPDPARPQHEGVSRNPADRHAGKVGFATMSAADPLEESSRCRRCRARSAGCARRAASSDRARSPVNGSTWRPAPARGHREGGTARPTADYVIPACRRIVHLAALPLTSNRGFRPFIAFKAHEQRAASPSGALVFGGSRT
jgi:hypothetical protein